MMASPELTLLVLAAAFWIAIHLGLAGSGLRAALIARLGANGWRGIFSLLSAVGLVWLIYDWRNAMAAYAAANVEPLWDADLRYRLVALVLMAPALLLFVGSVTTRNPTAVGGERFLSGGDAATGILRITRHPMLWSFALWAFAHVLNNGDLPSIIFFGAFLVVALNGTRSIDAKRAAAAGDDWQAFAAQTSNIPFAAIVMGRNRLDLREIGLKRIAIAGAAYIAILLAHGFLFGVPLIG